MKPETVKKDARDYLPWAGWFVSPEMEPDAFRLLPGWRQRESRAVTDSYTNRGRSLTPGERRHLRTQGERPVMLGPSRTRRVYREAVRVETATPSLLEALTHTAFNRECTAFGAGQRLRSRPPLDGLFSYAWHVAAVYKGYTLEMPYAVLADLEDELGSTSGAPVLLPYAPTGLISAINSRVASFVDDLA